jgi:hypothetical protein
MGEKMGDGENRPNTEGAPADGFRSERKASEFFLPKSALVNIGGLQRPPEMSEDER